MQLLSSGSKSNPNMVKKLQLLFVTYISKDFKMQQLKLKAYVPFVLESENASSWKCNFQ